MSPGNPMSGSDPSMILSTLTFTEIEFPAVDLTNGGISRFKARKLVSGLTATSLAAPAIVFRSRITLRPLVSVPPIDGNLASSRVVSPTCVTRSEIWVVLADRAEVAGLGSPRRAGVGGVVGGASLRK